MLCHGTPWSSYVWRACADRLSDDFTVYLWDMIGYGSSTQPDADVSIATQAQVLTELMRHWQLDEPHVAAHDIGGAVALRAHLLHGVALRSLTLVDVVVLRPWGSPFFRLVHDYSRVFEALPPQLHRALVREYISGTGGRPVDSQTLEDLAECWTRDASAQAAFYRQIAHADQQHTADLEPLLAQLRCSCQIVWGADDQWLDLGHANRLHQAIAHSELTVLDDVGHLAPMQAVDAIVAAIRRAAHSSVGG